MSQTHDAMTHQQDQNYYFDEQTKVWYNEDGVAVTTVYLPSLQTKLTRDEISSAFSCFGDVEYVRIIKKIKYSFGFVTFKQAESATKALSTKFHTIGGHETRVAFAEKKQVKHKLTEVTGTQFLSINDDCLFEILALLEMKDLLSLAATCSRLKDVVERIFSKTRKVSIGRDLNGKIVVSFVRGVSIKSMMAELHMCGNDKEISFEKIGGLLDLTKCCSVSLETLVLKNIDIPYFIAVKLRPILKKIKTLDIERCGIKGAGIELFTNCESLVELVCDRVPDETLEYILLSHYPKLERVTFVDVYESNFKMFLTRHQNIKRLTIYHLYRNEWSTIANYCPRVEELSIHVFDHYCVENIKRISTLDRVLKLKIFFDERRNVTKCIEELESMKSLRSLELRFAKIDSGAIPALCQLKKLQVLRLRRCYDINNLSRLRDLSNLVWLQIDSDETIEFDLVAIIELLVNLQILHVKADFKMDIEKYSKIAEVVRARPSTCKQFLEMTCFTTDDFQCDTYNQQVLKLNKLRE